VKVEAQRFGRFKLIERLAVGGMAELYRAELTGPYDFSKTVAIKKILPELNRTRRFRKMFLRESRIMADLNHGNLVQVYELGEVDGVLFMCIEYVNGCDLARLLKRLQVDGRRLPPWLAVWIVREVGRGLAYLHSRKDEQGGALSIVHRDVNPHNILLSAQGDVKLGDFGIAKGLTDELQTRQGQIKGKLEYLSPEQAKGDVLGPTSDLYALGLVLFELLTGQRYLQGPSDFELMRAAARPVWRSARGLNPEVNQATEDLLSRLLRPEPQARFASADALVAALDALGLVLAGSDPPGTLAAEVERVLQPVEKRSALPSTEAAESLDEDPLAMVALKGALEGGSARRTGTMSLDDLAPPKSRRLGLGIGLALVILVSLGTLWVWLSQDAEPPGEMRPILAQPAAVEPAPKPVPKSVSEPVQVPVPDSWAEVDRLLAEEPEAKPRPVRKIQKNRKKKRRPRVTKVTKVAKVTNAAKGWSRAVRQAWRDRWRTLRKQASKRGVRPGDCLACDAQARAWAKAFKAQDERAALSAAQGYGRALQAQRIDGDFIDRKLRRLRSAIERSGKPQAHEAQVKLILTEVVDGRLEQANRAINRLYSKLK